MSDSSEGSPANPIVIEDSPLPSSPVKILVGDRFRLEIMPALLSSLFMVFWLHLLRNFVENLCSSDEDEGTTYTSKEEAYNKFFFLFFIFFIFFFFYEVK